MTTQDTRYHGTAVLGLQWGDEGKGKIVDFLSERADCVVRFQGGNNAGHTLVVSGEKFVLHLLPSGVLGAKECIIGPGVVFNVEAFFEELEVLRAKGREVERIFVDPRVHLVLPAHLQLDLEKESDPRQAVGSTKRGIGPAYSAKYARAGVRLCDLYSPSRLNLALDTHLAHHRISDPDAKTTLLSLCEDYAQRLRPHLVDAPERLNALLDEGKHVLFEGAQAVLLDIDYGTYPFVTSSSPTRGGASVGSGVPPHKITKAFGVCKAYTTRVGLGPFPTEIQGDLGERIRERGKEYGASTGRPRRVGYLDLVALRYAIMINGIDGIALTKMDVLSGLDELKVAVAYQKNTETLTHFPALLDEAHTPVYETLKGWQEPLEGLERLSDLPQAALAYLEFIERFLGVPIVLVSTGPDREQTLFSGPLL